MPLVFDLNFEICRCHEELMCSTQFSFAVVNIFLSNVTFNMGIFAIYNVINLWNNPLKCFNLNMQNGITFKLTCATHTHFMHRNLFIPCAHKLSLLAMSTCAVSVTKWCRGILNLVTKLLIAYGSCSVKKGFNECAKSVVPD